MARATASQRIVMLLTCLLLIVSWSMPALSRQTIWQRAKAVRHSRAKELERALARVFEGRGNEMDYLLVRTGLVELMRDSSLDARSVVLLFRLRRELGLTPARGGTSRLLRVDVSRLHPLDRALYEYELARLYLDEYWSSSEGTRSNAGEEMGQRTARNALPLGGSHLDEAVAGAWEPQLRSEVIYFRAMHRLLLQRYAEATKDLELLVHNRPSPRWLERRHAVHTLIALAQGDLEVARRQAALAHMYRAKVRTVGARSLFSSFLPFVQIEWLEPAVSLLAQWTPSLRTSAAGDAIECEIILSASVSPHPWVFQQIQQRLKRICLDLRDSERSGEVVPPP